MSPNVLLCSLHINYGGDIMFKFLICFIAGLGAGLGTGFAGMSAAAVISPVLITFLGMPLFFHGIIPRFWGIE